MARLKDKNSPPALPVFWMDASNGHRIWWDTAREYWLSFMQRINDYTDGNGKPRVPESDVENQVCAQFPGWACDGPVDTSFPAIAAHKSGGCCGRGG